MGYLKRVGTRKYHIMYDVLPDENGKRRQKRETLVDVDRCDAERIIAERKALIRKQRAALLNGEVIKDEITLAELFETFMKAKKTNKETTTMDRYEALVRLYLRPRFGSMKAGALKPFHLMSAYSDWQEHGRNASRVSPRTIRHVHELLRNILNWGVRKELLTRNVAALISQDDLPKTVKPKPTALTDQELRQLLAEAKNATSRSKKRGYMSSQPWFYPAVAFAAYTGARRGEILALRWADIDLDGKSVVIARSVTESLEFKSPKNDRVRIVTMPDSLCVILRTLKAAQAEQRLFLGPRYKDQDLVFAHADGRTICPWNFGRAVLDCIKRAGVTAITLHGLRDTHASLLAQAGVPIEVISQRLGHSSIGVTVERYLHVYQDRDADAAAAFERLVG